MLSCTYLQQAEAAQGAEPGEDSWPFRAGDKVAVLEGPFAGTDGRV